MLLLYSLPIDLILNIKLDKLILENIIALEKMNKNSKHNNGFGLLLILV